MPEYKEVRRTIKVPSNTGKDGFLQAISYLLERSHVQQITIESDGRVSYRRMVLNGEEDDALNTNMDFEHVKPYHIIRNSETMEYLHNGPYLASTIIAGMLDHVADRSMSPIGFVVGKGTVLWSWFFFSTKVELGSRDRLFGYPLYSDRNVPDTALVLCSGFGRNASLVDTKLALKVEMPSRAMKDEVDVL